MKEKTFEELIKDFSIYKIWWANAPSPQKIDKNFEVELINFGKQVREATIEEVLKLADDNFFSKKPKGKLMENIENLPTDRIKTEK